MLLHLPIVVIATVSPAAISDAVPKFDIVRECRFEGGSTANLIAARVTKVWPFGRFNRRGRNLLAATRGAALAP